MEKLFIFFRYLRHFLFSGFYHLGWPVAIRRNIQIDGPRSIYIGNNIVLDTDCVLNVVDHHQSYKYNYPKPIIKIENNAGISKGTFISAVRSIHIKKNVMIGPYCFIGDYDHEYTGIEKPIVSQPLTNIKPIVIEEGAWIGAHVVVVSGVTIGKNSVVGANSVVTNNIPDYCLAAGVPAKVIKRYDHKIEKWIKEA